MGNQLILSFLRKIIYANDFETKEKQKFSEIIKKQLRGSITILEYDILNGNKTEGKRTSVPSMVFDITD